MFEPPLHLGTSVPATLASSAEPAAPAGPSTASAPAEPSPPSTPLPRQRRGRSGPWLGLLLALSVGSLAGCTYLQEARYQMSGDRGRDEQTSQKRVEDEQARNARLKATAKANQAEIKRLDQELAKTRKALAADKASTIKTRSIEASSTQARKDAEASLASLTARIDEARKAQAGSGASPEEVAEQERFLRELTSRRDALAKAVEQSLQ